MGDSSQQTTQSQQSTTTPNAAAQPLLGGLLDALNPQIQNSGLNGTEAGAIQGITNAASTPNPYAPAISSNAASLLAGGGALNQAPAVQAAYQQFQQQESPLANNTNYDPTQTPGVAAAMQAIQNQVTNQVNGQFAAGGRSFSGANQGALAYNLGNAEAPLLLGQYNQNVQNQQGAANSLYNAGNTSNALLSGMQQQYNANTQLGTQAATDAWNAQIQPYQQQLIAQQLGQSLPAQNLGLLANIGIPIAQAYGSTTTGNGTSNTTNSPSLLSDIGQGVNIASSLFGAPKGGTSAAAGLGQAGSGILSGLTSLLAL